MSSTIDQNETTSLSDGGGDANVTAATFTSSNKDDAPTPVDATKITTTTQEQQCRRQPQRRRLGIDDIVRATPLEEEAETFIVEAIENRERLGGSGNPDNDDEITLLAQVPEGSEAIFVSENLVREQQSGDDDDDEASTVTSLQRRQSTNRSSESVATVLRQAENEEVVLSPPKTVEDTLFGLTTALSAMQRLDGGSDVEVMSMSEASDTDMAANMNRIHHRGKKGTATSVVVVDADGASVRIAAPSQRDETLSAMESGRTQPSQLPNGGPADPARPWYGMASPPILKYLQEQTIVIQGEFFIIIFI